MAKEITPTMDKEWNRQNCVQLILEARGKETEGMSVQYRLLRALEEGGYTKAAELQRNIISDEKNHDLIYQAMQQMLDGDILIDDNDMMFVLNTIKKAIEKDDDKDD